MSITARSGGIMLPIARSIAELYDSRPGETAGRLGRFLMAALYQGSAVSCAMFLTAQASNVLVAGFAAKLAGVTVTWSSWFVAGLLPGLVSTAMVPLAVRRLLPPEITRTPAAASFAAEELFRMGRLSRDEAIALVVFSSVLLLWMTTSWRGIDVAIVALGRWERCSSRTCFRGRASSVSIRLGHLRLVRRAADDGRTVERERQHPHSRSGWAARSPACTGWACCSDHRRVLYAHYFFASVTAHALAMFQPFVVMLISLGTPPLLAVYSLACLANLTAGLTHYGTTTAPIVFAEGYVGLWDWWRVGLLVSFVNLAIWLTVGFAWWKLLGFW
jgi:DASS family divalent anion:Na+ symporter